MLNESVEDFIKREYQADHVKVVDRPRSRYDHLLPTFNEGLITFAVEVHRGDKIKTMDVTIGIEENK